MDGLEALSLTALDDPMGLDARPPAAQGLAKSKPHGSTSLTIGFDPRGPKLRIDSTSIIITSIVSIVFR